jgi:hypothetical protein
MCHDATEKARKTCTQWETASHLPVRPPSSVRHFIENHAERVDIHGISIGNLIAGENEWQNL